MKSMPRLISLPAMFLFLWPAIASAQGGKVDWMNKKIQEIASKVPAADAGDSKSHAASPSVDSNGTSIVDRSNPGEFFNLAMALASNGGVGGNGIPTGTLTTTLYAVLAALERKSLIDPVFYKDQRYLRRLSFTMGTSASDKAKDGTTTDAAVYGFRLNLFDGKDLYAKRKGGGYLIEEARDLLKTNSADADLMTAMTRIYQDNMEKQGKALNLKTLDETFSTVTSIDAWFASLPAQDQQELEGILKRIAAQDAVLTTFVMAVRKQLEKPRQLSIAYFTNQRKDGGADDHRAELIFDWGFDKRLNWTVNAGLDYRNVYKHTGGDRKGSRLATEMQYKLYSLDKPGDTVDRWVTFDFGGEWKAMTGVKPYIKGQAKLTIPLLEGVSLPIVLSYESRSETQMGNAIVDGPAQKKFKFGLAFDPGKLKALAK
jgi:hypothetical protein